MKKIILLLLILGLVVQPVMAGTQAYWIKGYKYTPLYSICQKKDIEYDWDSVGRTVTLTKNGVTAKIRAGSDKMLINGQTLKDIGPPLYFHKNTVVIPIKFANNGLDKIFKGKPVYYSKQRAYHAAQHHTIKTIVLDPGHGGKDPGAVGRYYKTKEKTITLDIVKRLKKLLTARGIKVYLTRNNDKFIPLWKRAQTAHNRAADLFISIHANSARSRRARGFEVFCLSEATNDSARALEAAENSAIKFEPNSIDRYNKNTKATVCDLTFTENRIVSRELSKELIKYVRKKIYVKDRGVKSAQFHVLKNINTSMPAALVEVGFLSNKKEEGQLKTSSHRKKIAEGLAKGILSYKNRYEKTDGFSR